MKKYFLIGFFLIGAISMLVMSLHFFQSEVSGILKYKDIATEKLFRVAFKTHIFFGIIAIFTGPVQFLNNEKSTQGSVHRKIGYVYFVAVLVSAIFGFLVAPYAMGGIVTHIGFSILAVIWFSTIILAVRAAKRKDFITHKKWMYISYGLTFAAITQRTMLLIPLLLEVEFITIYRASAWLPWMINSGIAWYLFRKSQIVRIA